MIRVVVVDDQNLFLDSLELYLSQDPEIEIIGTATNGATALALIRKDPPDVLLLDLRMPGMDGIRVARQVRDSHPEVRIIVLTTFEERDGILNSFVLGCEGYILKDVKPADLVLCVRSVFRGFTVMHHAARSVIRDATARAAGNIPGMDDLCSLAGLTAHEIAIVRLLSDGFSNKEIAGELGHTEGTVKNYVSRILQKTGCKDRTQVAIQFLRQEAE